MKKYILALVAMLMVSLGSFAQADKILGNYQFNYNGKQSKVKVFKQGSTYSGQITYSSTAIGKDGKKKLDVKNPDASKRNVPVDQVVIVTGLKADEDGWWTGGKIYDPTSGKSYNLKCHFKDDNTLELKGGLMGIYTKTLIWNKIK